MYDALRGALAGVAFGVFALGLLYQVLRFFHLTQRKDPVFFVPSAPLAVAKTQKGFRERVRGATRFLRTTVWGSHPLVMAMTALFHFLLIVTPFFVLGHNLLLDESWGIQFWSFSERVTDGLTLIVLLCALFFLLRRLLVRRVRAITTAYDYLMLLIASAPFLTGTLAYHQWFDYETVMLLHILAGEVMLVSIPFTRLGHMLFFFLYRFFLGSEHSFTAGSRAW